MTRCGSLLLLSLSAVAWGQKALPPLHDGTVVSESAEYRHDGPLRISGKVKLQGISLDLRGPIQMTAGADLELRNVSITVSDPPGMPNGTSGLRCEGPTKLTILHSKMTVVGSAHPIWWLQGEVRVDDFQTLNSEFHLDHVHAEFDKLRIFELEISHASRVIGKHLQLVFLSTHTSNNEEISFSDLPTDQPFSKKLRMGSSADAELEDASAQFLLVYIHGGAKVNLNRIGRAQLAIAAACRGTFTLAHGMLGSIEKPLLIPASDTSNCPFQLRLAEVNVDTWDVYAGGEADLTFTHSVIDELTADGRARIRVRDSEVYADWLSLGGDAQLEVERSTVGAQRLAAMRPDLATSQVRLAGHSRGLFSQVSFDCGLIAGENATLEIRNPAKPPEYIQQLGHAVVRTDPPLVIQGKEAER